MLSTIDLSYPALLDLVGKYVVPGRTESRAFLIWFLQNYYRLEETDSLDAVCDRKDDKGVDGVYVDDNLRRIDVLQSKIVQNTAKTLGDTQLKEFVGTLSQFRDPVFIKQMAAATTNPELAKLLLDKGVSLRVEQGYEVRGIFVTNARRDSNAEQFLSSNPGIVVYDEPELQ